MWQFFHPRRRTDGTTIVVGQSSEAFSIEDTRLDAERFIARRCRPPTDRSIAAGDRTRAYPLLDSNHDTSR